MGIGLQALRLTGYLYRSGCFKNFTGVIEIGSQDISAAQGETASFLKGLVNFRSAEGVTITPEIMYKSMGFKTYKCIDADGRHDALAFDLNKDISKEYGFRERFDLVTNHGTSEHVFDQYNVFRNMHNLCAAGGMMIHGLPFQGCLNHGLYNYQPSFFSSLAAANDYELPGIYLNIDDRMGDLAPYSNELMSYLNIPAGANMPLFVILKKMTDAEFRLPYDTGYLAASSFKNDYQYQQRIDSSAPDIGFVPIKVLAKTLLRRVRRKLIRI